MHSSKNLYRLLRISLYASVVKLIKTLDPESREILDLIPG